MRTPAVAVLQKHAIFKWSIKDTDWLDLFLKFFNCDLEA